MKLRHPWLIRLAAWGGAALARGWLATLRLRLASEGGGVHPVPPQRERLIYCFWHEALLAPATIAVPARVLISRHADGEFIAQLVGRLGIGVARGSTGRGGCEALLDLLTGDAAAHLAITPDGPRGPRRQAQAGAVFLASQSGRRLVPLGVGFGRAWRAPSWDRFAAPWPGSTLYGVAAEPLAVPSGLDRAGIEHWRARLQAELDRVTAAAEAWAAGTPPAEPALRSAPRNAGLWRRRAA